jgi:hypothetical protein
MAESFFFFFLGATALDGLWPPSQRSPILLYTPPMAESDGV